MAFRPPISRGVALAESNGLVDPNEKRTPFGPSTLKFPQLRTPPVAVGSDGACIRTAFPLSDRTRHRIMTKNRYRQGVANLEFGDKPSPLPAGIFISVENIGRCFAFG